MNNFIFILHNSRTYIVNVGARVHSEAYNFARAQLKAKNEDVTPWGELNFKDSVALVNWNPGD